MQTSLEKLQGQKFLLSSLIGTGIAMLIAESLGREVATIFTNWIFLPIPAALVVLSIVSVKKHSTQGSHGRLG